MSTGGTRITELIGGIPPHDTSGARATNRLSYQQSWGLCQLLSLHEEGQDYLIIFDYHEDIVIVTYEAMSERASFYQVKSKDKKNWTLNSLLKRAKSKDESKGNLKNSIIGKLRKHELDFEQAKDSIKSINFVTNAGINLKLDEGVSDDYDSYCFGQLCKDQRQLICKALNEEFRGYPDFCSESKYWFVYTNLPPKGHDTYLYGEVCRFLDKHLPHRYSHDQAFFLSLKDTILKKTKSEGAKRDRASVLKYKALTREQFEIEFLNPLGAVKKREELRVVEERLQRNGMTFSQVRAVLKSCVSYYSERNQLEYSKLADLRNVLIKAISEAEEQEYSTYRAYIEAVCEKVQSEHPRLTKGIDQNSILAMVVIEDEEYQVSPTFTKSEEEAL